MCDHSEISLPAPWKLGPALAGFVRLPAPPGLSYVKESTAAHCGRTMGYKGYGALAEFYFGFSKSADY